MINRIIILFLFFIVFNANAQDTLTYYGIVKDMLYESIKLYPDSTFKWSSEYDLSYSSYGKYKQTNDKLRLEYYIDFSLPKTMTLKDSILTLANPIRIKVYRFQADKLYLTKKNGKIKKRIKEKSIHSTFNWLIGFKYKMIRIE